MVYISTSSGLPSAGLDVSGDLKLIQKQPLAHKGLDERFSAPIFNKTTIFPEAFNFKKLIRQYNEQNGMQICSSTQHNEPKRGKNCNFAQTMHCLLQRIKSTFF